MTYDNRFAASAPRQSTKHPEPSHRTAMAKFAAAEVAA